MAKTWILDTETKGTGAHIAPLPRADTPGPRDGALDTVTLRRPERHAADPQPAPAATFKVVDVLGARVVAEGVDARAAVAALQDMRSVHDARVYIRVPAMGRWRLLRFAEQRTLWAMRASAQARTPAAAES